jgi:hypothetical protein
MTISLLTTPLHVQTRSPGTYNEAACVEFCSLDALSHWPASGTASPVLPPSLLRSFNPASHQPDPAAQALSIVTFVLPLNVWSSDTVTYEYSSSCSTEKQRRSGRTGSSSPESSGPTSSFARPP